MLNKRRAACAYIYLVLRLVVPATTNLKGSGSL
jgi:hypothetical protein